MTEYTTEQIIGEIKPLSGNTFLAFFQRLWRWWLGVWYGYAEKHPGFAKAIQQFFVMLMLSNAVTIYQMLVMMFLPYAFTSLWYEPFVWPAVELPWTDALGTPLNYAIFNEAVKFLTPAGESVLAYNAATVALYKTQYTYEISGLGNFLAFEIATFTAQCINLPLQRNITFHSNGNVWSQAMWYFIGWVLISIGLNALWGIMNPIMQWWNWNKFLIDVIKTVLTGGVSMLIFFFIFRIIFPDVRKVAAVARKKADEIKNSGADSSAVASAELNAVRKEEVAKVNGARLEQFKTKSVANSKCMRYNSVLAAVEKLKADAKADVSKTEAIEARIPEYYKEACEAIDAKIAAAKAYEIAVEEVTAAMSARGENTSKVHTY